ncbi:MAG TPA: DUF1254 domain-containing protein [Devosiaceae bacterium]|jgi:hypothetical protein
MSGSPHAEQTVMSARGLMPPRVDHRTIARRGVEAVIWGIPLVSVYAMRRAFFAMGARYGDILYLSRPATWKFQTTTPNASSLYVYFNFNLQDGPVVVDVPAATGAGLFGSIVDAWEVPLADVGPQGEDGGKGGKFLLLPPGFGGAVPAGYLPLPSHTHNGYALLRAIPVTSGPADTARAIELVRRIAVYPLAEAFAPPEHKHIDIADEFFDGLVGFDESFYECMAHMVNEEPVQTRDFVAMAQLRSLGIIRGQPFDPDAATRTVLRHAAHEAHSHFMRVVTTGKAYWPGTQWIVSALAGPRTGFDFLAEDHLDIDERGTTFFLAYGAPKSLGAASFYVAAFRDAADQPLQGHKAYGLHVPAEVPVEQYWAATVYDLTTAGFFRQAPSLAVDSHGDRVLKNPDGSVDIHIGPTPPEGRENNWIYTEPGKPWFTFFRFYGPGKAVFDKSWSLPDIKPVGGNSR